MKGSKEQLLSVLFEISGCLPSIFHSMFSEPPEEYKKPKKVKESLNGLIPTDNVIIELDQQPLIDIPETHQ